MGRGYVGGKSGYKSYIGKKSFREKLFRREHAFYLWFPFLILYDEVIFRVSGGVGGGLTGVFYTLAFSLSAGCVLSFAATLFSRRVNVIIADVISFAVTLIYIIHLLYLGAAGEIFRWAYIRRIGELPGRLADIMPRLPGCILPVLLLLLPPVVFSVWGSRLLPERGAPAGVKCVILALAVAFHAAAYAGLITDEALLRAYGDDFSPETCARYFGLMTETRLDLFSAVSGQNQGEDDGRLPTDAQNIAHIHKKICLPDLQSGNFYSMMYIG